MSERTVGDFVSLYQSRIFKAQREEISEISGALHLRKRDDVAQRWDIWKRTWDLAHDEMPAIPRSAVLNYGLELGRCAESYGKVDIAQSILDELAEDAVAGLSWIPKPAEILIQAGEFSRRLGDLHRAEGRFNAAVDVLEKAIIEKADRDTAHRQLGRAFYEFAYIHRHRGDVGAARSALERSEVECRLGSDPVGAEVAKSLMAAIAYEEGSADLAIAEYEASLQRFQTLEKDPKIVESGRAGLARRWIPNVRTHLGLAYLAADNEDAARRIIDDQLAYLDREPSIAGAATVRRVEAQLSLAEGNLPRARDAIEMSWAAVNDLNELRFVELAAATLAVMGLIHALAGEHESSLSCFEQACGLPPDMHNRRAQGWAWAGRALLAEKAVERRNCIIRGLEMVERCGAPIRAFLLTLMRDAREDGSASTLETLRELICRSG